MIAAPLAEAWTPACMEPDELVAWQEMNARTSAGHAQSPCSDCLPAFSAEMHRAISPEYPQGRCNGTPRGGQEVDDVADRSPMLPAGTQLIPPRDVLAPALTPQTFGARHVSLEVTAPPCATCAHEPVCGLRVALEGLASINADAPSLPAGLTLSLAATVECSHFLRDKAKPAPVRVLTSQERGQANGAEAFRRAPREISDATRQKMRDSAIAARARKAEGAAAG